MGNECLTIDEAARWKEIQAQSDFVARQDGTPTATEQALCGAVLRAKALHDELLTIHRICLNVAECPPVQEGDTLTVRYVKDLAALANGRTR